MTNQRWFSVARSCAAAFGLTAVLTTSALGDYLVMLDGRMITGEIVEIAPDMIRIRFEASGIWTTATFNRSRIDYHMVEDGDQSDLSEDAESQAEDTTDPNRAAAPASPKRRGPWVAVIPLHGYVGGVPESSISGTFDAPLVQKCLSKAFEEGAEAVILDIDSPGGLVSEMEAICETIIAWHDRLRIVAYPDEAYSAAAIIALCCKDLAVRSDSQFGAAVIVKQRGSRVSAVDAKYASPHHARQRQYMAASGQPYEVVAAMTIQETELWFSPTEGFNNSPPDSDRSASQWKQLDGERTVLTITGDEAVEWGLAATASDNPRQVALDLGLDEQIEIVVMDDIVKQYNRALENQYADLLRQIGNYFNGLNEMARGLDAFAAAARQGDRKAAARAKGDVNRGRNKALSAGRKIRRADRSVIARRVAVPEQVLERMESDAVLIGRIRRLLETNQVDDFNDAVDRINEVIEQWRELLK